MCAPDVAPSQSISGLVVEYIVAIDVTRVRFPADASIFGPSRIQPSRWPKSHRELGPHLSDLLGLSLPVIVMSFGCAEVSMTKAQGASLLRRILQARVPPRILAGCFGATSGQIQRVRIPLCELAFAQARGATQPCKSVHISVSASCYKPP